MGKGRPKKRDDQKRNKSIGCKVTTEEKAEIYAAAEVWLDQNSQFTDYSDWIRLVLLDAARPRPAKDAGRKAAYNNRSGRV